jgi:hypothetical protein
MATEYKVGQSGQISSSLSLIILITMRTITSTKPMVKR